MHTRAVQTYETFISSAALRIQEGLRFAATVCSLIASLVCIHQANSQILPFRTFTVDDGLPSNQIRALCQDGRGYLWIGTYGGGVSMYDGTTFRNYTTLHGLPSMIVWSLTESRFEDDVVWLGTWGGLCRADGNRMTAYLPRDTSWSRTLYAVYEDFDGSVWCGTPRGIQILPRGDSILVSFAPDTSFGHVVGICQTSDSTVYIASWNGLWTYKRGRGIRRLDVRSQVREVILALYADRDDTVWIGRRDRMVLRFVGDRLIDSLSIPQGYFHRMAEDSQGDLWCASSQGVARIVGKRLSDDAVVWYNVDSGLPESAHRAVFVDNESNVWIAAAFKGLTRLTHRNIISIPLKNVPDHPVLASCVCDRYGHYWVASTNGVWEVWQKSAHQWDRHFHTIGEPALGSIVSPRCVDPRGNVWMSQERGLALYRVVHTPESRSRLIKLAELRSDKDIPSGPILRAHAGSNNTLWISIGNVGLVAVRNPGSSPKIIARDRYELFGDRDIRTLFEDSRGRLWLGGTSKGLAVLHFDGDSINAYRLGERERFPGSHVRAICETPDGLLWVGFAGGIAALTPSLPPRVVATLTKNDGLMDGAVFSLLPLPEKGLWVGTGSGLQSFDGNNLHRLKTEPSLARTSIVSMGYTDDKRIWILSYDGVRVFQQDLARPLPLPPPVQIVKFEVNDRTMDLSTTNANDHRGLTLAHDENNCTIEFGGISLTAEEMLEYKYRLLPTDEAWHGPTVNRTLAFPSLQPGTYTFEVMAIGPTGLESPKPASVTFTILPAVWETWWFRIAGIALVGAVLFGIYRYRVRQLLEVERLRLRISADLHDELASNLSSIALFSSIIKEGSTAAKEQAQLLDRIGTLAQESLGSIRHLIWAIAPKTETLPDLMTRLRDTMTEPCRAKNIALRIEEPTESDRKTSLSGEQRQHLWLMLKEAITNAIKHSRCTELVLRTERHHDILRIIVRDNGCGFDGMPGHGKGLGTMRMRAEHLKGTVTVDSSPGKGTTIVFQLRT